MPLPARPILATLLLGLPLIAGCASSDDGALLRIPERQRLAVAPTTNPASTVATPDVTVEFIPDGANADDYVKLAMTQNPSIEAVRHRVAKMRERIPQMTSLEDPMLEVTPIGEMSETMSGEVMLMTRASQKLPFPGKLSAQGAIAEAEMAQAQAELQQTTLEVASEVRRAYWSYYLATRSIEVTERTRELLKQIRDIADSRSRAGQGDQTDVLRAGIEQSEIDNELVMLLQRRTASIAMLNSLLDRPIDARLPEPPAATLDAIQLKLDEVLRQAADANPELKLLRHRIDAEQQKQKLAFLQRFPDLTIIAGYSQVEPMDGSSGKDEWSIGFAINVPIWFQKYRAAEREALQGRLEAIAELAAAQNRVSFKIIDAMSRVTAQQKQVELFRDNILPQSRQAADVTRNGYQSGRTEFTMMVETSRRTLSYEVLYHQNLAQLEQDLAELEQLIGGRVVRRR